MLTVEKIDTSNKKQVNQFVQFHYDLYKGCPQWVPPFFSDIKLMLNREKHPFYEHSDADFFIAQDGGKTVGRLAMLENKSFNKYHNTHQASFYLFDSIDSQDVTSKLFERGFDWARQRGLDRVVGPKGFGPFDGYGIQVEGIENRQMMTMMNYNFAYYKTLVENIGFEKEVDFVSCYMGGEFKLPEKVHELARRVVERGTFEVVKFANKKELTRWAWRLGQAYNKSFINNWEYYPLTEREVKTTMDNIMVVLDYRLVKLILHEGEVVGFLLAFPDISAALQRHSGRITPWGIVDIMGEMKRTDWVSFNGVGVLPEFKGRGGNGLLYSEMEKTIKTFNFKHAEMTQMADTAVEVRKDMVNLGAKIYKAHRIFNKAL
jgi:GNAT superfamily N-acetyltransferase